MPCKELFRFYEFQKEVFFIRKKGQEKAVNKEDFENFFGEKFEKPLTAMKKHSRICESERILFLGNLGL